MTDIIYTNPTMSKEIIEVLQSAGAIHAESRAKERGTTAAKVIWHSLLQNQTAVLFIDRTYIDDTMTAQIYKALAQHVPVIIRNADGIQTVLDNKEERIPADVYDTVADIKNNINMKYGRIAEQKRMKATEDRALTAIRRLLSEHSTEIATTLQCLAEYDEMFPLYAHLLHANVSTELLVPLCNRLADVYDVPRPTPDPENYHPEMFDSCGYWTTKGGSTEPKCRHNSQYMTDTWALPKNSRRYNDMYERDGCNEYTDWDMCYQLLYYLSVHLLP